MNNIRHQAVLGAVVAAALVFGASASSGNRPAAPSTTALTIGAQEGVAVMRQHIAVVAVRVLDNVLDDALDAFGEIAARLKQL